MNQHDGPFVMNEMYEQFCAVGITTQELITKWCTKHGLIVHWGYDRVWGELILRVDDGEWHGKNMRFAFSRTGEINFNEITEKITNFFNLKGENDESERN